MAPPCRGEGRTEENAASRVGARKQAERDARGVGRREGRNRDFISAMKRSLGRRADRRWTDFGGVFGLRVCESACTFLLASAFTRVAANWLCLGPCSGRVQWKSVTRYRSATVAEFHGLSRAEEISEKNGVQQQRLRGFRSMRRTRHKSILGRGDEFIIATISASGAWSLLAKVSRLRLPSENSLLIVLLTIRPSGPAAFLSNLFQGVDRNECGRASTSPRPWRSRPRRSKRHRHRPPGGPRCARGSACA